MSTRAHVYESRAEAWQAMNAGHELALVVVVDTPSGRRLWPFASNTRPAFVRPEAETMWFSDPDLGAHVGALVVHIGIPTGAGVHIEEAMLLYRSDPVVVTGVVTSCHECVR